MANFIKLHTYVMNGVYESTYINMDVIQEILPPVIENTGARLISIKWDFGIDDSYYYDVKETIEEIMDKL